MPAHNKVNSYVEQKKYTLFKEERKLNGFFR